MRGKHYFLFAAFLVFLMSQNVRSANQPDAKVPKDPLWQNLLKDQLKHEKNCELSEILTYNEMKVGDSKIISGKVLCLGGQEYEYTQMRKHLKFEFRACDPSVC